MKTTRKNVGFGRKIMALAVIAAFGPAHADDEVAQLTQPESRISVGAAAVSGDSKDRTIFGQYSGMRKHDAYGLFDVDIVKRDNATGTWTILQGRNLGLDNRELGFRMLKQGDWGVSADYSELVRHDPRTINTGLQGAGTTTPSVVVTAVGAGSDLNLDIKRKALSLGGDKWITPNLQFELNFKNEDKDGARLFGKGFQCTSGAAPGCAGTTAAAVGWAVLMLPEPINSTTRQVEAKLNYSGSRFMLSGGYYGSFYSNANGNLTPTVPASLNNAVGTLLPLSAGLQSILNLPMALPPDNQAHQIYVTGNYAFTKTTKATFKYAYTHATQDDDFLGAGLTGAPAGRSNLGGVLNTTLAQVGLTARPLPKLSLLANLKYEDKKDKTPIDYYNIEGATTFTNSHIGNRKVSGKVEASYQFVPATRGTFGIDYQTIKRELPPSTTEVAGLMGLREKATELGYRAELRQTIGDSLSGTIAYSDSRRKGSDWYNLCVSSGCTAANPGYGNSVSASTIVALNPNAIFPAMLKDRDRSKWRVAADWSPTNALSLQFSIEDADDKYTTAGTRGLQESGMTLYSADASWSVSDAVRLTGFVSHGVQTMKVNHNTAYRGDLRNTTDSYGIGVVGSPSAKLQLGADFNYLKDTNRYGLLADSDLSATHLATLAATGGLPDVNYRLQTLKLYGKYALDKHSDIRIDLVNYRAKLEEWTWGYNGVPFVYSDNTTVSMNPNQKTTYIGARYIYKWR